MGKPSLYGDTTECFICHNPVVHRHHIYFGVGRRQVSEREGCTVYLCPNHHTTSDFGVHFDKELDNFFKCDCQRRWERREGIDEPNHETFISVFGRSYL